MILGILESSLCVWVSACFESPFQSLGNCLCPVCALVVQALVSNQYLEPVTIMLSECWVISINLVSSSVFCCAIFILVGMKFALSLSVWFGCAVPPWHWHSSFLGTSPTAASIAGMWKCKGKLSKHCANENIGDSSDSCPCWVSCAVLLPSGCLASL